LSGFYYYLKRQRDLSPICHPKFIVGDGSTCCSGRNKRKEVIRKYTQIGYFTLNLDDAKEYLYAKSTKRRILSWRDIHVNVFI